MFTRRVVVASVWGATAHLLFLLAMLKSFCLAAGLLLAAGAGRAQVPPAPDYSLPYAASITPAALHQDLTVLASDKYEGRGTGRQGQKMAADYLAKAFAAAGLAGPVANSDNPYLQHFQLSRTELDPASSIKIGHRTFVLNRDFYVILRDPTATTAVVQPAFVGYGISTTGYADFALADPALQHQNLVLLLGEPLSKTGQPLLGKNGQASAYGGAGFVEMGERSPALRSLAPRATFRIMPSAAAFDRVPHDYVGLFGQSGQDFVAYNGEAEPASPGSNVFFVSPAMGAAMLGTTPAGLARYQRAGAAAGRPAEPLQAQPLTLHITKTTAPFTTENVLGYLAGTDKKDEVLVLSAHYDHVGVQYGAVYNGADDDGSGTVSVLALARAFAQAKKAGHGPRRSILFLACTGEEKGLLGSRYYAEHPIFPLASTIADLNIDMIGRVDSLHQGRAPYLYLIGANRLSAELNAVSEATNQQYNPLALDYTYNAPDDPQHLYTRSDHYNFAKHGVPVIYYTSGLHADYHERTDDVEKIDFPAMARRDQLVFHTAWALANREQRPAVDTDKASRK